MLTKLMSGTAPLKLAVIISIFVVGQVTVGYLFDLPWRPVLGADSVGYLAVAADWSQIKPFHVGLLWFLVLLSADTFIGTDGWLVVGVQISAVIAAAWLLHKITTRLGGPIAGWVAVAVYLLHPPITQWTRYLLTESLFYSFTIFFAWAAWEVSNNGANRARFGTLAASALVLLFLRPNGVLVLVVLGVLLALWVNALLVVRLLIVGFALGMVLVFALTLDVYSAGGGGDQNSFLRRAEAGEVLWNDDALSISMPEVVGDDYSNRAFLGYVAQHPLEFMRLGATRLTVEMAQVRPHFSNGLNLYLGFTMTAFYTFAGLGWWRERRSAWSVIVWAISIPTGGLIAVTWAVHEARFGWWFLVLWIPWAAIGFTSAVSFLQRNRPGSVATEASPPA